MNHPKHPSPIGGVLIAFTSFFLLLGYEFIRSSVNTIYKSQYGAENIAVVMALSPVFLIFLMYIYNVLLSFFGPQTTLLLSSIGTGLILIFSYFAVEQEIAWVSAFLFVFKSGYVVLLIEQYWSFINSVFEERTAKKWNGPIIGISSIGAVIGGLIVSQLATSIGTNSFVLLAGLSMIPCSIFSALAYQRAIKENPQLKSSFSRSRELQKNESKFSKIGVEPFERYPNLKFLLSIVLITQVLAGLLQINFQITVSETIANLDEQTAFLGTFFGSLNFVAMIFQFVVAPLALAKLTPYMIHLVIPFVHFGTLLAGVLFPGLETIALSYFMFKAIDYSIFRAAKEIFYLPMDFDARFRSKELIDVLGYRFSKGALSGAVAGLKQMGFVFTHSYMWLGLLVTGIWLGLVYPIFKKSKSNL